MKNLTTRSLTKIAIMAALVYVASAFLQIPISTAIDNTRIHMGNVLCLLSGIILGPVHGGLAAGLGSMLFDLTNPAYIATAPLTFVFKFIMAWVCGKLCHNKREISAYFIATLLGSISYTCLYLGKNFIEHYFLLGSPLQTVMVMIGQKAIVSITNGIISIIVAVTLAVFVRPLIDKINTAN